MRSAAGDNNVRAFFCNQRAALLPCIRSFARVHNGAVVRCVTLLTAAVLSVSASSTRVFAANQEVQGPVGDRLVLAVNDLPYSQRQVEAYITVKESLRQTSDGSVRSVSAANWDDALTVFAEDMIVLQESQRLGSFQAPADLLAKFSSVVQDKTQRGPALRQTMQRLGVDDAQLGRTLEIVLRVAAFRRSRDRHDVQNGAASQDSGKWLVELTDRAIVRRFEGAAVYVVIEPILGGAAPAAASPKARGKGARER